MISESFKKKWNGNQLKLVAVISMLVDHIALLMIGYGILPRLSVGMASYQSWYLAYVAMRSFGRMAFPIYAYLLVEGYTHTRNWKRYALRLGIFAILSEIPFDLIAAGQMVTWQKQNVFFTLLLGLFMMKALDRVRCSGRIGMRSEAVSVLQFGLIGAACAAAWIIKSDYDYIGILLIAVFYWFRGDQNKQCLCGFVWYAWAFQKWYYICSILMAFLILYSYNGRRGSSRWKYGYYMFYPVHMLVLEFIFVLLFAGK